jgi:HlyD family secretion protein
MNGRLHRTATWALVIATAFGVTAAIVNALPSAPPSSTSGGGSRPDASRADAKVPSSSETRAAGGWIRSEGYVIATPGAEAVVSAESFGRITDVPIRVGDGVDPGAALARLTVRDERAALLEATGRLHEAEADVSFLTSQRRRTERLSLEDDATHEALEQADHALAVAVARREIADAQLARAQVALDRRTVRSPLAGTVIARDVDPGMTVSPGTPIATIADLSHREIQAQVDEFDLPRLGVGAAVRITAEGYGDQFWTGRVTRIPSDVVPRTLRPLDPGRPEDTGVLLVKIALPRGTPLKLGQRVELWIAAHRTAEP